MSSRASVERAVREVVASMANVPEEQIDLGLWITAYRIDSLSQLIARETLERVLAVYFSDDMWVRFRSMNALIDHVEERRRSGAREAPAPQAQAHAPTAAASGGVRLSASGMLYDDLEIGMPLTGRNNLAEGPLLQYLGDLRWKHLGAVCGVPSKQIVDADGNRLYSTFFYVEIAFPEGRPMASYGENDRFRVASTMQKFGDAMLDGTVFLLPEDAPETGRAPFPDVAAAAAAGTPAVRLSNVFVRQFTDGAWLKKSRPANPGVGRISEMAVAPECYAAVKQAGQDGTFGRPGAAWVPLTDGPVQREYKLIPDRDLNGAGLVYFANYPVFLDICEREVLASSNLPLPPELIDRRTLVRRRTAYLNNASATDTLDIETEAWIENPLLKQPAAPEMAPIRLFLNHRMRRRSDGHAMMVSTAEKLIFGRAMEDLPAFPELLARCT
jgi:probable biosynthetic protein (TIGR04098 family)